MIISMNPDQAREYLVTLQRRREITLRLCATLQEFLVFDVDENIARCGAIPKPTVDDLIEAQQALDAARAQAEALDKMCNHMPTDVATAYRESMLPTIERLTLPLQQRVCDIQKSLEQSPSAAEDQAATEKESL